MSGVRFGNVFSWLAVLSAGTCVAALVGSAILLLQNDVSNLGFAILFITMWLAILAIGALTFGLVARWLGGAEVPRGQRLRRNLGMLTGVVTLTLLGGLVFLGG